METLDVCVGTNHSPAPAGGSGKDAPVSDGSVTEVNAFSRGSRKKSSGSGPLLVIVTGTVTGVPAVSTVPALCGRLLAVALTTVNETVPLNGSASSLPVTGSPKSAISVQVPGSGLSVEAVRPVLVVPVSGSWFWP